MRTRSLHTLTLAALAALTSLTLGACSSTDYGDPNATETVNADYGSTDLQTFAGDMAESLMASPNLAYLNHEGKGDDLRIVVVFGQFENRTREHIDLTGVADKMIASMVNTGRFRFVAGQPGQDEIGEQVRFQQGSGRVDPEQAKAFGKQLGADMVIYGSLRDITKEKGRSLASAGTKLKDVYFQFVLKAVNIETGEIIWANESEIRKRQVTGLFG